MGETFLCIVLYTQSSKAQQQHATVIMDRLYYCLDEESLNAIKGKMSHYQGDGNLSADYIHVVYSHSPRSLLVLSRIVICKSLDWEITKKAHYLSLPKQLSSWIL